MVNIRENWAEITGEITSMRPDKTHPDFQLITIHITANKNYKSFPNLVKPTKQNSLTIKIRKSDLEKILLKKGDTIQMKVRAAPDAHFISADSLRVIE